MRKVRRAANFETGLLRFASLRAAFERQSLFVRFTGFWEINRISESERMIEIRRAGEGVLFEL